MGYSDLALSTWSQHSFWEVWERALSWKSATEVCSRQFTPFQTDFYFFPTSSLQLLISAGRTNIRLKPICRASLECLHSPALSDMSWGTLRYTTAPQKGTKHPRQGHRRHDRKVSAWQREAQRHPVPHLVQNNSFKENNSSEQAGPPRAGSSCSYWKSCHHARPHQHWIYCAAFLSRKCLCGAEQAGSSRTELCPCPQALPWAWSCLGIFHTGSRNTNGWNKAALKKVRAAPNSFSFSHAEVQNFALLKCFQEQWSIFYFFPPAVYYTQVCSVPATGSPVKADFSW